MRSAAWAVAQPGQWLGWRYRGLCSPAPAVEVAPDAARCGGSSSTRGRAGRGPAHRGRGVRRPDDPASHAYRGKTRAQRDHVRAAGHALRLLHLRHALVREHRLRSRGQPPAVLLRAGAVVAGVRTARGATARGLRDRDLARGPARLARLLGLARPQNGAGSVRPVLTVRLGCRPREARSCDGPAGRHHRVGRPKTVAILARGRPAVSVFRAGATGCVPRGKLTLGRIPHDPPAPPPDLLESLRGLASGAAQILPATDWRDGCWPRARSGRCGQAGIDPSGSDLHAGHAVVLRKLRQFQDGGHTPSSSSAASPAKSATPRTHRHSVLPRARSGASSSQRPGLLRPTHAHPRPGPAEVVNNDDWLGTDSRPTCSGTPARSPVAQLLERDRFARPIRRPAARSPVGVQLPAAAGHRLGRASAPTSQLGGTDQTFNNLVGRELQRALASRRKSADRAAARRNSTGWRRWASRSATTSRSIEPAAEQFGKLMSNPGRDRGHVPAALHRTTPPRRSPRSRRRWRGTAGANRPSAGLAKAIARC